ncbi:twin-arginine translocation signal domain-containing protein [Tunturiibacter lichenicola]|uniref:twin-arginine translocation signal domain-containing protein n=1 Tax=Tunturiibacter lichenicola TaxID=2051959 RepID=UPI0021B1948F|nr:twin-arginine translocation signal domain-containing protein [Edaphobacter lichenicola]
MNIKTERNPDDSHAPSENTLDPTAHVSRRAFMTTSALAGAGVATLTATAQTGTVRASLECSHS